jgi:DNA polymerase-3 subunit epsilon
MRQIFLDTETTGLSAESGDRIIEIGCLEMVNRRLTGRNLHHYVNPQRSSHPDAVKVHGLTDEFLADKPVFATIAPELVDYLRDAELIIHNAAFDVGFLDAELMRAGLPRVRDLTARVTDSLLMARERFPGKSNSLDALCSRLEVDNKHRQLHGALLDAGLLAEVYIRMTRGQDTLMMEEADAADATSGDMQASDLSRFVLTVLQPTQQEAEAHAAMRKDLDAACGGRALWQSLEAGASVSG